MHSLELTASYITQMVYYVFQYIHQTIGLQQIMNKNFYPSEAIHQRKKLGVYGS